MVQSGMSEIVVAHLGGGLVISFVDVLVDMLERLDGLADLNVDVSLVVEQQERRERYNPFASKLNLTATGLTSDRSSVSTTSVRPIAIVFHGRFVLKGFPVVEVVVLRRRFNV